MVGFVAQPDSNELPEGVAVNPINTQNAPAASFGEIAGAGLNTGLTADYGRWAYEQGQKTRDQYIEPQPKLSPEDIKEQYGIDTKSPLPAYEAKYMADAQQREKQYKMATQNASGLKTFAADTTAFLADPINLGSLFVPYVGEERVAAAIGADTATAAGRAATRAVTGAGAGIVSQAPLSALKYGFSQTQGVDYGVADALKDTLYAGAAGAIAGPLFGGVRDMIFGKSEWADTIKSSKFTDNQSVSQVGLAQMAKENAINIEPMISASATERASIAAQKGLVDTSVGKGIEQRASEANPELYKEYHTLKQQNADISEYLHDQENSKYAQEIKDKIKQANEYNQQLTIPPTDLGTEELHAEVQKRQQMASEVDTEVRRLSDTEGMLKSARETLQNNDYRLRDIAPDVNKIYETAKSSLATEKPRMITPDELKQWAVSQHESGTLGLSRQETQQAMDDAVEATKQPKLEPDQETAHYQQQADELEARLRDRADMKAMEEHDSYKAEQDKVLKGYTDLQKCLMG